jgi:WD40-like Beta Propeller Repeat
MAREPFVFLLVSLVLMSGCQTAHTLKPQDVQPLSRLKGIPSDAAKITQATDPTPPISENIEYSDPKPVPGVVNTAGAEDSPFITPDGRTLYFFFTPDVRVPVERQLLDGITGIYVSRMVNGSWQEPERVVLQDEDKLSLDGCLFVLGNRSWFCSAREGYSGIHWFTADYVDSTWQDWRNADGELKKEEYDTGELHMSGDGMELYFHANRAGGKGGLDIWVSRKEGGVWSAPENVTVINTERDEGWPALNPGIDELWFNRDYGVWRSKRVNGEWQAPEQMFGPLAGEPTIDGDGNVYFVHHYFKNGSMVEADIYVAERK